jgi:beta-glucosidase
MFDIFSLPDVKMPEGFLWGSGYAGHQVEGNNVFSNCWANEQANPPENRSGMACNSYELWEEDVALACQCGLQAFRTSVEWSRIEPREGEFCPEALEHYVRFFASLQEKGIRVFATLVHFTVPLWFAEKGGFPNLENRKYFERYLEYVVPRIAPYVSFWNVLNEFNLTEPEFKLASLRYHALGYHVIKKYANTPVSSAHALVQYMPKRPCDRFDRAMAEYKDLCDHEFFFHAIRTGEMVHPFTDGCFCPEVKGTADFWSINTYVRDLVDARTSSARGTRYDFARMQMIDTGFYLEEFNPECVVANLGRLHDKPIYITENGVACKDDRFRIVFLAEYLSALQEAIRQGADVRGYLYWSLLDNFEWGSFRPTFGLYAVDRETFVRTAKPSAAFYRDIIARNGVTSDLIGNYLKEMPSLAR